MIKEKKKIPHFFNSEFKFRGLQSCDYINKYTLLNIYSVPCIKKMEFKVSLLEITKFIALDLEDYEEDEYKTILFFLFFLFGGVTPFLKNIIIKPTSRKKRAVTILENVFFCIRFSQPQEILNFLFYYRNFKRFKDDWGRPQPIWLYKESKNNLYFLKIKDVFSSLGNIQYLFTTELLFVSLKENLRYFLKLWIKNKKSLIEHQHACRDIPFLRT
jgi:hypothetical protein